MPAGEIAETLKAPQPYLSNILAELVQSDLVESVRGRGGGFRLARPPERISVGEVVGCFQPDLLNEEGRCVLGAMRDGTSCLAHERWGPVAEAVRKFFAHTTLRDLATMELEEADE